MNIFNDLFNDNSPCEDNNNFEKEEENLLFTSFSSLNSNSLEKYK